MRPILTALLVCLAGTALATDLNQPSLAELKWQSRPIVIFGDAPGDPRVIQQLSAFEARSEELEERDVVIIVDTDPDTLSDLRRSFRPRDFMVVLVGKDGEVKYRKPSPVTVREIMRLIDRMPMRQQEIRAAKDAAREEAGN